MKHRKLVLAVLSLFIVIGINAQNEAIDIMSSIALKVPGNDAKRYQLTEKKSDGKVQLKSEGNNLPVKISKHTESNSFSSKLIIEISAFVMPTSF